MIELAYARKEKHKRDKHEDRECRVGLYEYNNYMTNSFCEMTCADRSMNNHYFCNADKKEELNKPMLYQYNASLKNSVFQCYQSCNDIAMCLVNRSYNGFNHKVFLDVYVQYGKYDNLIMV